MDMPENDGNRIDNSLPKPDINGIIRALPDDLSAVNRRRMTKFGWCMFLYDAIQEKMVRPRLHKADPQKHRQILQELLSEVKNDRVLDVGCGSGAAMEYFHESNEYTGLDLSYALLKQAVKKLKRYRFSQVRLVEGNAEHLLFDSGTFDTVLVDTSLHMIPDCDSAIHEIGRVLKTGGFFICSTPAVGLCPEFDRKWTKIAPKRDLHAFSKDMLITLVQKHGLNYTQKAVNGGVIYFRADKTR